MADKSPNEIVVEKLNDRELLRNYCTFAGMHRAILARTLFKCLGQDPNQRRSIGLEIAGNFVAALEDVALWFFALKEWKPGQNLLFDLLDRIQIKEQPGYKYSSEKAVAEMSKWTIADMRQEFGLPRDEDLLALGWSNEILNEHINGLREALIRFQSALQLRIEDEGILRSSYNKIKHGALAIAATEYSSIGVSVMIPSRTGPKQPSGKRKINVGWVPCEDGELRTLVKNTVIASEALWAILNLIYMSRFDRSWIRPAWPIPFPGN